MKKVTALALASVMALGACSAFLAACKPKDEPPPVDETAQEEFEAYRTQLAVYARGYNGAGKSDEQKQLAQKAVNDIAKTEYDASKSLAENKGAVNEKVQAFRASIAQTLETPYAADADLSDYLNLFEIEGEEVGSRTLRYNGLLANALLGAVGSDDASVYAVNVMLEALGGGKASYSSGEIVLESKVLKPESGYRDTTVFTEGELNKILALEDEALKEETLAVTKVSQLYRSSVVSFVRDNTFVVTNHYTQLGCDYFNATLGKEYVVGKEYYKFGTYEIAEEPIEGSNEYSMNAKFDDGTEAGFYVNAATGVITRRDNVFSVMSYAVVDETTAATGGYDFDADLMSADDYVLSRGVTFMKDVRYGERTMLPYEERTDENASQYDLEAADPSILEKRECLDIYIPAEEKWKAQAKEGNGVILLIHGGSWTSGEKESMLTYARDWADKGYFAVSINHTYGGRQYDNGDVVTFYDIQNEIDMAMQKVKDLSDEYGWNITKAATNGYSSGSHLAAWYAYDKGNEPEAPIPVVCTFSMVGPMSFHLDCWTSGTLMPLGPQVAVIALNDPKMFDFGVGDLQPGTPEYEEYINSDKYKALEADIAAVLAGTKPRTELNEYDFTSYSKEEFDAKIDSISPLSFVKKGDAVPTVLAEACLDTMLISGEHGIQMEKALTEAGIEHTVVMFPNCDHMGSTNAECGNVYRAKYTEMLKKYFGY